MPQRASCSRAPLSHPGVPLPSSVHPGLGVPVVPSSAPLCLRSSLALLPGQAPHSGRGLGCTLQWPDKQLESQTPAPRPVRDPAAGAPAAGAPAAGAPAGASRDLHQAPRRQRALGALTRQPEHAASSLNLVGSPLCRKFSIRNTRNSLHIHTWALTRPARGHYVGAAGVCSMLVAFLVDVWQVGPWTPPI